MIYVRAIGINTTRFRNVIDDGFKLLSPNLKESVILFKSDITLNEYTLEIIEPGILEE